MSRVGEAGAGGVSRAVERLVDMIQSDYGNTQLGSKAVGDWLKENSDAAQLSDLLDRLDNAMTSSSWSQPSSGGSSAYPAGTRYAVIRRDELPY